MRQVRSIAAHVARFACVLAVGALFAGRAAYADHEHNTGPFMGVKANTGFATHSKQGNLHVLTLSDDFKIPEVPSGSIEPKHIVSPLRALLKRTIVRQAEVKEVDLEKRIVVACHCGACPLFPIQYDHLVLALGGVTNFFGLPGVAEHALTMKSLADAGALHAHVSGRSTTRVERTRSWNDSSIVSHREYRAHPEKAQAVWGSPPSPPIIGGVRLPRSQAPPIIGGLGGGFHPSSTRWTDPIGVRS